MAILTVSRLYGSGGSEVAAIVAKTLGWSLLDNAVVDAVATRMGLSIAEVQAREERVPSLVERLTSAMAMGSQEWASPIAAAKRPTDEQLIEVTRHIIEEAIVRGPVVVVGRGAQEMLADADPDMRTLGAEEVGRVGRDIAAAEADLRKLLIPKDPRDDKNIFLEIRAGTGGAELPGHISSTLALHLVGFDEEDVAAGGGPCQSDRDAGTLSALGDLSVNTERLGIEGAADLIVIAAKKRFGVG